MIVVARVGTAGMSTLTPLGLSLFPLPRLLPPTPLPRIRRSPPSLTTVLPNLHQVVARRQVNRLGGTPRARRDLHMGVRHLPAIFMGPAAYTHRRCCRTEPDERHRRRRGRGATTVMRKERGWRYETYWVRTRRRDLMQTTTC